MLPLQQLHKLRQVAQDAEDDPEGAMQQMLELLLPALPPLLAGLVYELLMKVNPEEIVNDYDFPLDTR